MPSKPRKESPSGVYHFITRGVNRMKIFHSPGDYCFYLELLAENSRKLGIQIYHYCLMSNHAHLLLRAESLECLSQLGHITHIRYAYFYSRTRDWSGQVFRRNFHSLPIPDDIYLLECGRYIERNPIKADLVNHPHEYPYSSYSFYALGKPNTLITESPFYANLGNSLCERMAAYRLYVCQERDSVPVNSVD